VVTRTGEVPALDGAARGYVITSAAADPGRVRAAAGAPEVIVAGEEEVDLAQAMTQMSRLGLPRVLLEGGPSLLADAAAAGRVDELCLTISPVITAATPRISHGPPADLQLRLATWPRRRGTARALAGATLLEPASSLSSRPRPWRARQRAGRPASDPPRSGRGEDLPTGSAGSGRPAVPRGSACAARHAFRHPGDQFVGSSVPPGTTIATGTSPARPPCPAAG
jgi:hypothetical protein